MVKTCYFLSQAFEFLVSLDECGIVSPFMIKILWFSPSHSLTDCLEEYFLYFLDCILWLHGFQFFGRNLLEEVSCQFQGKFSIWEFVFLFWFQSPVLIWACFLRWMIFILVLKSQDKFNWVVVRDEFCFIENVSLFYHLFEILFDQEEVNSGGSCVLVIVLFLESLDSRAFLLIWMDVSKGVNEEFLIEDLFE
jgi:hypothetical protein